jgi:hypothetical protein
MNAPVSREWHVRAHDHYRQVEFVRFRNHAVPVRYERRHLAVLHGLRIVPYSYYQRRAIFYETYGYVFPEYYYALRPAYGIWDTSFLGFMLWRLAFDDQYTLMYYYHMNDPDFIAWRQEVDGLAADNAELREQLAVADERVAELQGTPPDDAYVPDDAGDVALSPDVIDRLASASEIH